MSQLDEIACIAEQKINGSYLVYILICDIIFNVFEFF